jgi:hypothetical protein
MCDACASVVPPLCGVLRLVVPLAAALCFSSNGFRVECVLSVCRHSCVAVPTCACRHACCGLFIDCHLRCTMRDLHASLVAGCTYDSLGTAQFSCAAVHGHVFVRVWPPVHDIRLRSHTWLLISCACAGCCVVCSDQLRVYSNPNIAAAVSSAAAAALQKMCVLACVAHLATWVWLVLLQWDCAPLLVSL